MTTASIVNYFHVLCGSLWLGGAVFASTVTGPVLRGVPGEAGSRASAAFYAGAARFYRIAGTLAILLGIAVAVLEHRRGSLVWISLVLALALFVWGELAVKRSSKAVALASDAGRAAAVGRVVQVTVVENLGFLTLLGLMVALRYGG